MSLATSLVTLLSRRTSGRPIIREIDGLRTIAILSVVAYHAEGNFSHYTQGRIGSGMWDAALVTLLRAGEYGVPLFFVISGFVLAVPFAEHWLLGAKPVDLRKYFLRRITRLEPPYFLSMLVFFLAFSLRDGKFDSWPHLLASLTYLHSAIYHAPSEVLVVAWSLEVEVQFYILAPLACFIFCIRSAWLRRLILCSAIVFLSAAYGVAKPIQGLFLNSQASYFLTGLLLADYMISRPGHAAGSVPTRPRQDLLAAQLLPYVWDIIAMLSIALVFITKAGEFYPAMLSPWLILSAYIAVFRSKIVRRAVSNTWVVICGGMCYTIYLWHFPVIALFRHFWFKLAHPIGQTGDRLLYVVASSLVAIAVSAVLFALVEKPTMDPNWPAKLIQAARRKTRS